jgi:hypothetical protein
VIEKFWASTMGSKVLGGVAAARPGVTAPIAAPTAIAAAA